jgi:hypothetical protein
MRSKGTVECGLGIPGAQHRSLPALSSITSRLHGVCVRESMNLHHCSLLAFDAFLNDKYFLNTEH